MELKHEMDNLSIKRESSAQVMRPEPHLSNNIYRKSASRFSSGTVLNTLKQSRINIMGGKNDATTFPDKPVS